MVARSRIEGAAWPREQLESASPDVLREMVWSFADAWSTPRSC
jgi:hypothetical protein